MNLSSISKQLVHDMKASAAKTAVLGLLFVVGLCFWVPPLLKAFSGGATSASASTKSVDAKPAANGSSISDSMNAPSSSEPLKKSRDSQAIAKLLREQSLWQPVNAEEMPQNPFDLNDELFPLPVLIAKDGSSEPPPPVEKPVEKLDGMVLKSTLIGATRRVAMINNQLFREGQNVPWHDRQLLLKSVNRKSVTLTDGSQSWQLTLKDSSNDSDH